VTTLVKSLMDGHELMYSCANIALFLAGQQKAWQESNVRGKALHRNARSELARSLRCTWSRGLVDT
jgi:hypothetical protein